MKIRIKKTANDDFFVEYKGWFFWHRVGKYHHCRSGIGWIETYYYSSIEEAEQATEKLFLSLKKKNTKPIIVKEFEIG